MRIFTKIYLFIWLFVAIFVLINSVLNHNTENLLFSVFITGTILATYYIPRYEQKRTEEFIEWLISNKELIKQGDGYYQNKKITLDTEVTQFQISLACVVYYTKTKSRYYVRWHDLTNLISLKYSVISLLIGWIALPLAPFYTLQALITNIKGGKKTKICSIYEMQN